MKTIKTAIIFMFIFSVGGIYAQKSESLYYYAFDEKIKITSVNNKILVKKKESTSKSAYENLLKNRYNGIKTDWQGDNICKIEIENEIDQSKIIQDIFYNENILSVGNIFQTDDGFEFGFTNEIVVKFKEHIKDADRKIILENFELKISKKTKIYEIYTISKEKDVLEIANELYLLGLFEFAYPNIICKAILSHIPNDPYFQNQFTFRNIGQLFNGHTGTAGADIKAAQAWDITTGSSEIIVAVLDEGVTSNHPDLPNTRQVRLNGSNFGSGNRNDPSPIGNANHGNACAGVIAATMDNNEGIVGIAPKCKIMPLRWDNATTSNQMADAIEFAVENGANIVSNSWSYSSSGSSPNLIPAIVAAIQYAINNGVIVVFSAGNTAQHKSGNVGHVNFPGNANVNYLITVGASDRYDKQADYSPSNSLVDIVAPSHRAYPSSISTETFEIWSIDIPGNTGYNPWPATSTHPPPTGETLPGSGTNYLAYTGRFGGTSHSCPVIAGVAALMLSVSNCLTPEQVFNILTSTADKVGGYVYANGKCNQMGYGRVNAFEAVKKALTICYCDHTVTENIYIETCRKVKLQDVSIEHNGKLNVKAPEIEITGPFNMEAGAELDLKIGQ